MLYNDRMLKQCLLNCVHIESEKGGVDDEEMGGCHFSYYFTVQFNHILCVRESKVLFITFRIFSLLSHPYMIFIHILIQVLY